MNLNKLIEKLKDLYDNGKLECPVTEYYTGSNYAILIMDRYDEDLDEVLESYKSEFKIKKFDILGSHWSVYDEFAVYIEFMTV